MVYVAWVDGTLTLDEIAYISGRLQRLEALDDDSRRVVADWLDPEHPPDAEALQRLRAVIRRNAGQLKDTAQYSIAELGAAMNRDVTSAAGSETHEALGEIEKQLGLAGTEAARDFFTRPGPRGPEAVTGGATTFPVRRLTDILDAPYGEVRNRLRALLSSPDFAYPGSLPKDEYRELVLRWCRRLADEGFGRLGQPTAQGGAGDLGAFIATFETLAVHDLSLVVKFGVQFGLFGGSVQFLGTKRHHDAYLAAIGGLDLPGCFAMTELGHGSNVWDLETTASYDPDSSTFLVHTPGESARKEWIGNAAVHGRLATVFAQLEVADDAYGVHAFLVPIRDESGEPVEGVRIEDCGHKEGLNGVDNGRLWFDHVRVPRENLLNRYGDVSADGHYSSPITSPFGRFFTMLGTLVGGRISVAAAALSAAKSGLAIGIRYAEQRRQFGPTGAEELPILDYLALQRRLLPRLATAYAIDFTLKHVVDRYLARTEEDGREVEALAAGAKAFSSWNTIDTLQQCREACGGQGYLSVNRLPSLKSDSDIFATFEGDNTVLMQLVAKALLTDYRDQFGEMRLWGAVKYLADRAATRVLEMNPIVTRQTDEDHLRSPEFHQSAFDYRVDRLLGSAARRLKSRIDDGMDSFAAFNDCQDHLVRLARAHVERVVYTQFREAVSRIEDNAIRTGLEVLRDLFALWRFEMDAGWFLETGYFESGKAQAIRSLVSVLCREVRGDAVALVDAFGIPESCLAAPIAFGTDPRSSSGGT